MDRLALYFKDELKELFFVTRPMAMLQTKDKNQTINITTHHQRLHLMVEGEVRGEWSASLNTPFYFSKKDWHYHWIPQSVIYSKDWDYSLLPRDTRDPDYLKQIFIFIEKNLGINSGAIFLKSQESVKLLQTHNLKLNDKSEFILKEMLERNSSGWETIAQVGPETYSLLFDNPLFSQKLFFVRSDLNSGEKVILCLPGTTLPVPEGILKSLFALLAHGVIAHLAYQRSEKALINVKEYWSRGMYWGETASMVALKNISEKLAKTELNILIQGETGTGKERLAKYVAQQMRVDKFIIINCANIPKDLADSFLFGHKKGVFPWATKDQEGKLGEANEGILFLDEVSELSLEMQAKLVGVLQEKVITPMGGTPLKIKFKIISSTSKNLLEAIAQEKFRKDLYYLLSEANLFVPALKDRGHEDILSLALFFLEKICTVNNLKMKNISWDGQKALLNYSWPLNIRELQTTIKKAAILSENQEIEKKDLFPSTPLKIEQDYPLNLEEAQKKLAQDLMKRALILAKGQKQEAAKMMGLNYRTFFRLQASINDISDSPIDKNVTPSL